MNLKQKNVTISLTFGGTSPQMSSDNLPVRELSQIPFTMTAAGTFDNLINFLKAVRGSRYYVKLDALEFTSQEKNFFNSRISGKIFAL